MKLGTQIISDILKAESSYLKLALLSPLASTFNLSTVKDSD